jgi:hypothetical protein
VGAPADGSRRGGVGGHGRRLDLRRRAQARRRGLLFLAPARLHGLLPRGDRRAAPDLAAARGRRRVRQGAHQLRRRFAPGPPHPGVCTCTGRGHCGGAAGAGAGDLITSWPAGGGGEGWRGRAGGAWRGVRRRRGGPSRTGRCECNPYGPTWMPRRLRPAHGTTRPQLGTVVRSSPSLPGPAMVRCTIPWNSII